MKLHLQLTQSGFSLICAHGLLWSSDYFNWNCEPNNSWSISYNNNNNNSGSLLFIKQIAILFYPMLLMNRSSVFHIKVIYNCVCCVYCICLMWLLEFIRWIALQLTSPQLALAKGSSLIFLFISSPFKSALTWWSQHRQKTGCSKTTDVL